MDSLQAKPLHLPAQLTHGKLSLPAGKPFVYGDEEMFNDGVNVVALRHIDEQQAAFLKNTDVFSQQCFGLLRPEMLKEPLMEDDVECSVVEWKAKRIPADNRHGDFLLIGQAFHNPERIDRIVELKNLRTVLNQGKAVAPRSRTDFEDFFPFQVNNFGQIPDNAVRVRIDFVDIFLFVPEVFPV